MSYYNILGVDKKASSTDIKSAYRKLCKIHHPDKGGDETKFKEISEAYDILSDDQKRMQYDRYGSTSNNNNQNRYQSHGFDMNDIFNNFGDIFGNRQQAKPHIRGGDLRVKLEVTLEEVLKGSERKVKYNRQKSCNTCSGKGGSDLKTCINCNGSGHKKITQQTPFGIMQQVISCNTCNGTGKMVINHCKSCNGNGTKLEEEIVEIKLPKGVATGMALNMPSYGNSIRSGEPGDLHIIIEEIKHPKINREGNDLYYEEFISIPEAVLGTNKTVDILDDKIDLKIDSGCDSGKIYTFRGKGVPVLTANGSNYGIGSLYVKITVNIPKNISEMEKELYEKLYEIK
jgi:molecular chaperone DnaJ